LGSNRQSILFTSQSGLEVEDSVSKLKTSLDTSLGTRSEVVCAEGEGIGNEVRTSSISKQLIDSINSRYEASLESIKNSTAESFLVHLHCSFWKRSAFFTVVDRFVSGLERLTEVKGVVTLIDDFYSIYFRIRGHYDENDIKDVVNPIDLLYWRAVDVMLAQMIANQARVPHFVIAVNHPLKLLTKLIATQHTAVYAGHPITDIRNLKSSGKAGLANSLMQKINETFLCRLSQAKPFVTFVPDAIDEYPILEFPRTRSEIDSRIWPRMWLTGEDPIALPPERDHVDAYLKELLESISTNKTTYEDAISGQVADRDYRLVNQSENFIFTLPKEIRSSKGVEAELTQARYGLKDTYFFNPDNITRGKNRPAWANNLTGECPDLTHLMSTMAKKSVPPLISIKESRKG